MPRSCSAGICRLSDFGTEARSRSGECVWYYDVDLSCFLSLVSWITEIRGTRCTGDSLVLLNSVHCRCSRHDTASLASPLIRKTPPFHTSRIRGNDIFHSGRSGQCRSTIWLAGGIASRIQLTRVLRMLDRRRSYRSRQGST